MAGLVLPALAATGADAERPGVVAPLASRCGNAARDNIDEKERGTAHAVRFVGWGLSAPSERHFAQKGFLEARRSYLQRSGAVGAISR